MRTLPNPDPFQTVFTAFDAVFRMLFPVPEARRVLGYRGISERLAGRSGWFLWFDESPGAYSMELADAHLVADGGGDASLGIFALKYYPGLDDSCLALLSPREQEARTGALFDATGTPTLDGLALLDEDLFVVGFLDVLIRPGGGGYEFRLRSREGAPVARGAGERARAWRRAWTLADRLIVAFGHHHSLPPARVSVVRRDGARQGTDYVMHVAFGRRDLLLDQVLPLARAGHPAHVAGPRDGRGLGSRDLGRWFNPQWWLAPELHFCAEGVEYLD